MPRSQAPIAELAESYLAHLTAKDASTEWASFEVGDLCLDGRWDRLWELIEYISTRAREPDPPVLAAVAAGPLEDLLSNAGPAFMDAIEDLVRRNQRAARMLTGVWRSSIQPDIWQRVVTICRKVADPLDGVYRY